MEDCIFCKIINGDIPSAKIYEDDAVYAFLDLGQVTKGHTLVVPKKHARNMLDLDEDTAAQLFRRIPKIANAVKNVYNADGLNILNNNEEVASQTVFHCHVHLIPRYSKNNDDFGLKWKENSNTYTQEELLERAEKISALINL
ncbi:MULTISPECIES: HIT family protein [unclassified Listeria]|uniref:HIT family protein n=1 Tax=unclassified Listeria TaxID=2642072 RepID=UPI000B59213A|nr:MULTISPECIES: HIT family protein [unclassified Listeria]